LRSNVVMRPLLVESKFAIRFTKFTLWKLVQI
jgi:hypothetical protein